MECTSWENIPLDRRQLIWSLQKILSSLSMASIAAVFGYVLYRHFKLQRRFTNPAERLMFFNLFPVFVRMIGGFIANDPWGTDPNNVNMPYCQAQTAFVEFGDMGCVVMGGVFARDLYTIIHVFRGLGVTNSFTVEDLSRLFEKREKTYIVIAYLGGFASAITSTLFAGPRDLWCWVRDIDHPNPLARSHLALIFFYAWMWIVMILSITVLLYAWCDVLLHKGDFRSMNDIRYGCIVAFSSVLLIDLVGWAFASANRFWTYANPGCALLPLEALQAIITSSRGLFLVTAYYLLKVNEQFVELEQVPEMADA
ncbi:hypothetical protein BC938DRAFT_477209, partial [Jimgerdemannia flammicorona]